MKKKLIIKESFFFILFIAIFMLILTAATLFFLPKRSPEGTENLSNGLVLEDENSIDVLLVGSCNMYTSFNPLLFYESTGITSYGRTCPDQVMSTSYYFIEEALEHQNPKVIVLDSLFVTAGNTEKRENYNRCAVDYMHPSKSKFSLINTITKEEVPFMQSINPDNPGKILTWASYVFPLLRYHSRTEFTVDDLLFFGSYSSYNYHKGSEARFDYNNVELTYDYVENTTEVNEDAKEYVPKIINICKEHNIPLLFINTPNKYRWDAETTSAAKEYVESVGGKFIDLYSEYSDMFKDYYYQGNTGRLNIYGMKVFTERLGNYLINTYNLTPTQLSPSREEMWKNDVRHLYSVSKEKGADISEGNIAQICNKDDSIMIRWNSCSDCGKYKLFKRSESESDFKLIDIVDSDVYYDKDVEPSKLYSYYIVPCEGKNIGKSSETVDYAFVETPDNVQVVQNGNKVEIDCGSSQLYDGYIIQKRQYGDFKFLDFVTTQLSKTTDEISEDTTTFYRIMNYISKNGEIYSSDAVICSTK